MIYDIIEHNSSNKCEMCEVFGSPIPLRADDVRVSLHNLDNDEEGHNVIMTVSIAMSEDGVSKFQTMKLTLGRDRIVSPITCTDNIFSIHKIIAALYSVHELGKPFLISGEEGDSKSAIIDFLENTSHLRITHFDDDTVISSSAGTSFFTLDGSKGTDIVKTELFEVLGAVLPVASSVGKVMLEPYKLPLLTAERFMPGTGDLLIEMERTGIKAKNVLLVLGFEDDGILFIVNKDGVLKMFSSVESLNDFALSCICIYIAKRYNIQLAVLDECDIDFVGDIEKVHGIKVELVNRVAVFNLISEQDKERYNTARVLKDKGLYKLTCKLSLMWRVAKTYVITKLLAPNLGEI